MPDLLPLVFVTERWQKIAQSKWPHDRKHERPHPLTCEKKTIHISYYVNESVYLWWNTLEYSEVNIIISWSSVQFVCDVLHPKKKLLQWFLLQHPIMYVSPGDPLALCSETRKARGSSKGNPAQTHVDTVHLRRHRNLRKEGSIAGQLGQAITVLDILHNVQNFLSLRLPCHSADV